MNASPICAHRSLASRIERTRPFARGIYFSSQEKSTRVSTCFANIDVDTLQSRSAARYCNVRELLQRQQSIARFLNSRLSSDPYRHSSQPRVDQIDCRLYVQVLMRDFSDRQHHVDDLVGFFFT